MADKPTSFTSIPTIDLAEIDSPILEVRKSIAKSIYDACHTCGFFYIKNHGIPEDVISETFALLHRFFALELETKMEAHVQKNPAIRGYEPMLETRLDPTTKGGKLRTDTQIQCVSTHSADRNHRHQRGFYHGRLCDRA